MSRSATVRALIAQQARTQPQALYALATENADRIDYAGLEQQCQRVATLLMAQGTQPGDTVSLVMPNGLNTLRLLLGALHGGWCVNPVNLLSSAEQMRYVLDHSDCKLVIASPEWADAVRAVLATLARPVALLVCSADLDPASNPLPDHGTATPDPDPEAMALLMYTSGTTGVPKGVVLTQTNLAANAHNISREHGLAQQDRVLAVLPLYHINAFAVTMLAPLAHGQPGHAAAFLGGQLLAASHWQRLHLDQCGADHDLLPARGRGTSQGIAARHPLLPQRLGRSAARAFASF